MQWCDVVQDLAGASTLIAAVGATEPAAQPITLFAPNNAAFAAISDVVAGLSAEEVLAVRLPYCLVNARCCSCVALP